MNTNGPIKQVTAAIRHSRRIRLLLVAVVLLSLVLGMMVVPIEARRGRDGNIRTMEDGIWWATTTVTGVGYGDRYPVTTTGRVIGIILETFGVVLFGSLAAIVSVEILRYQEDYYVRRILERISELDGKVEDLKKQTHYLIRDRVDGNSKRANE